VQLYNDVGHASGIFGIIRIRFVISNHRAIRWQQVGDTAAALGLGWVGEGRAPDGAKNSGVGDRRRYDGPNGAVSVHA
jgi:hypothetical protein